MKKALEYAIDKLQYFSKEMQSCVNNNYYEHQVFVEGYLVTDFATHVDALAQDLLLTSFQCQADLDYVHYDPAEEEDPEL